VIRQVIHRRGCDNKGKDSPNGSLHDECGEVSRKSQAVHSLCCRQPSGAWMDRYWQWCYLSFGIVEALGDHWQQSREGILIIGILGRNYIAYLVVRGGLLLRRPRC
jgi:hypothetical protein